jgi:hypothetical protein
MKKSTISASEHPPKIATSQPTLYKIADSEIRKAIESYLKLARRTKGLSDISQSDLEDERARTILLSW